MTRRRWFSWIGMVALGAAWVDRSKGVDMPEPVKHIDTSASARAAFYVAALRTGAMTVNDVRELEGLPALADEDRSVTG